MARRATTHRLPPLFFAWWETDRGIGMFDELFRLKEAAQNCAGHARGIAEHYLSFQPGRSRSGRLLEPEEDARHHRRFLDSHSAKLANVIAAWNEVPASVLEEVMLANAENLSAVWVANESFSTYHEAARAAAEWVFGILTETDHDSDLRWAYAVQEQLRQCRLPGMFGAIEAEHSRTLAAMSDAEEPVDIASLKLTPTEQDICRAVERLGKPTKGMPLLKEADCEYNTHKGTLSSLVKRDILTNDRRGYDKGPKFPKCTL